MNKQEFEDRIKSTVSDSLFEEWNRVYMAAGQDVDKDIFCNAVKATKGNSNLFTLLMSLRNKVELQFIYPPDVPPQQSGDNANQSRQL